MKNLTVAATAALMSLLSVSPIHAADLGTNATADLEERVAELEATTATKGTRKTSLTIYGEVSTAILWQDNRAPGYQGGNDNPNEPTRVGFKGQGKISPTLTAGYQLEFGLSPYASINSSDPYIDLRQANWWLASATLGKISLGLQDMSNSGVSQVSLANVNVAALGSVGFGGNIRQSGVRYTSPAIGGGFSVSISHADNEQTAYALRYAGESDGVRLAAAVAYSTSPSNAVYTDYYYLNNSQQQASNIAGSAAIMLVKTGLFADVGFGTNTGTTSYYAMGSPIAVSNASFQTVNWHGHAGIEKNWFDMGNTTVYGEYIKRGNSLSTLDTTTWGLNGGYSQTAYGAGLVQSFDSAALDLFAAVRHAQGGETALGGVVPTSNAFLAGARVRF